MASSQISRQQWWCWCWWFWKMNTKIHGVLWVPLHMAENQWVSLGWFHQKWTYGTALVTAGPPRPSTNPTSPSPQGELPALHHGPREGNVLPHKLCKFPSSVPLFISQRNKQKSRCAENVWVCISISTPQNMYIYIHIVYITRIRLVEIHPVVFFLAKLFWVACQHVCFNKFFTCQLPTKIRESNERFSRHRAMWTFLVKVRR